MQVENIDLRIHEKNQVKTAGTPNDKIARCSSSLFSLLDGTFGNVSRNLSINVATLSESERLVDCCNLEPAWA